VLAVRSDLNTKDQRLHLMYKVFRRNLQKQRFEFEERQYSTSNPCPSSLAQPEDKDGAQNRRC
jgi:hypothetical protein